MVTDQQVRKLMRELGKGVPIGVAAAKAGMDRKTASKYRNMGRLPSEMKPERTWRTRTDPFAEDWPDIEVMLDDAPELEAKALFDYLCETMRPGRYRPGQLRTFQRRVSDWRALFGPDREVFFPQQHEPGALSQTDFTWLTSLKMTVAGEAVDLLFCHVVLTYSNWEWGTLCRSESVAALKRGIQAAFFRLGKVTREHQTDNSTAATHTLGSGKRAFNDDYAALMRHLSMTPRTTGVGQKEQNGDVEAANGAFKRRVEQHLLLRGHRDFESVEVLEKWLQRVCEKANAHRTQRLAEELAVMQPLRVQRLPEFSEHDVKVTSWSTIRVKHNAYSVPSRLIDRIVKVRLYDDRLEVFFRGQLQMRCERLLGRMGHRINYRHIIWSLVRKPGAFPRYRYREDLFPTLVFRQVYDHISGESPTRVSDLEYLRILHLAASTMQDEVEVALKLLLEEGEAVTADAVKALLMDEERDVPDMAAYEVSLDDFDALLSEVAR